MQQAVPAPPVLATGEQHTHLGLPVGEGLCGDLGCGSRDSPVLALDDVERQAGEAQAPPALGQSAGADRVEVEVHRPQLVGCEGAGVLDGAGRSHVEAVDQHDHDVAAKDGHLGGQMSVVLELGLFLDVLLVESEEEEHDDGHHRHDHPGTLEELGDAGDQRHEQRDRGTDPVDGQAGLPPFLAKAEVVPGHACL